MKTISLLFIISLFINAVFGYETVRVSVNDGGSVTLHAHVTELQTDEVVVWWFNGESIARINREVNSDPVYDSDVRFTDRLKMNNQTGDLTITNITSEHTGEYHLEIIRGRKKTQSFSVSLSRKVKIVKERDSVSLHIDITEEQRNDKIHWKIKHNNSPVAEIITENRKISTPFIEERFRDRLKLDDQTGDLIITHMKNEDSGQYEADVTIGHTHTIHKTFSFTDSGLSSGWTVVGVAIGVAVGVAVCVAVGVVVAAVVFYYCCKRKLQGTMAPETVRKAEALTAVLGVSVKLKSQLSYFNRAKKLDVKDLMMVLLGKKEKTSSFLKEVFYVIPEEFFDPVYDLDFTKMGILSGNQSDPGSRRGNETYGRPYGWKRYGLNIRNKYPDGNAWLGTRELRNDSDPFEWPVSYHGTSLEGAEGIVKTHYKVGSINYYGRGIYSTPKIQVAGEYAKTVERKFKSKTNGKTYNVAIQNRINPEKREITVKEDYWLVPIPEGTSDEGEREIVESSIRPYGLLLKEMQEGN